MRAVLVPGFTQTPASWGGVVAALRPEVEPVTPDVPTDLDWPATVATLARTGGRGTWVGYSMGGRLALAVALDHPRLVDRLVLVSTTAGLADDHERAARAAADEQVAREIERDGVGAFLDRWLAQPLFAGVPRDAPGIRERARWSARELAAALRHLGTGTMPNFWPRLQELTAAVTIVTGRHDAKYTAIGDAIAVSCTGADVTRVHLDSGHAIPLEQPGALAALV